MFNRFCEKSLSLLRFVQEFDDLWFLKCLLHEICCDLTIFTNSSLLHIPNVNTHLVKQLFADKYKTMKDIAKARPIDLFNCSNEVPIQTCEEIILYVKQFFKDRSFR